MTFALTITAFVYPFGAAQAAPSAARCPELMASLTAADGSPLFSAGKTFEEQILAGESTSALNAARRGGIKLLTEDPLLAGRVAEKLRARGFAAEQSPGEVLLALDVLAKVNPDLFVKAVSGVLKWPLPPKHDALKLPAFKRQLGSRVVGMLSSADAPRARQLADIVARSPWLRNFFAGEVNAGRTLLTSLKAVPSDTRESLGAFRALADAWVGPRLAYVRTGGQGEALSQLPEMDWAFSRVISAEMSRRLERVDPEAAARFAANAAELARAPAAAEYRKNDRVKALLAEFNLTE
ncbi:MAG: hypothetical protein EOP11_00100 [Proteobacteria bacterium]|nr:MAG: hypothetical protein EOP11_00100 [Pseudomonadota bacterium]